MQNEVYYLKVKNKSLAEEAKIIRHSEKKVKSYGWHREEEHPNKGLLAGLTEHRKGIVRSEQRATLLAYAYATGRRSGEQTIPNTYVLDRAYAILRGFRIVPYTPYPPKDNPLKKYLENQFERDSVKAEEEEVVLV